MRSNNYNSHKFKQVLTTMGRGQNMDKLFNQKLVISIKMTHVDEVS